MHYLRCTNKLKIAFIFQAASFWPSWESLYEACISDERFEVRIFWIDGAVGDKAQMEFAESFLIEKKIPYEAFSYEQVMEFRPHYMIYQTPYDYGHRRDETWTIRYKRKGIRIVYIPYGIEISDTAESHYKHFSLAVVLNAFSIYTLSDAMKSEYEKYCVNAEAVKALGLPRFDSLQKTYELPEHVKRHAGERKIILWKSHFPKIFMEKGVKKQATPDLKEYLKFVEYIAASQDFFFIFMPHPKFADETIDEELRPDAIRILDRLGELSNVYIDKEDDYRNSLTNADAIIIDRSAVMVEAGIRGVPVLYMYNLDYKEPMTPSIQKLLDSYYQGTTADEMTAFCNMIRKSEDKKRESRISAFHECVPFCDGGCAERIKGDLWEAAHQDISFKMLERINADSKIMIFGTGDICRVCMEAYNGAGNVQFEITCFIDSNPMKQGSSIYGRKIIAPGKLAQCDYDYIVIATDKYYREIYYQLTDEFAIPQSKIMNYDEFVVMTKFETK